MVRRRAFFTVLLLVGTTGCASHDEATDEMAQPVFEHWTGFTSGGAVLEVEHYENISEMAALADAVVLGTMRDVRLGRSIQEPGLTEGGVLHAVATIEVLELLRLADSDLPQPFEVEFVLAESDPSRAEELVASVAQNQGQLLFFLRNKGAEARRLGAPVDVINAESGFYRLVSSQGMIENASGVAVFPLGEPADALVVDISGRPFSEVVELAR